MTRPVRLLVLGVGCRGETYGRFALSRPDLAKVVGVAEPRPDRRTPYAQAHNLPANRVFDDWRQAADAARRERFADAVIIATQDAMHVEPALAFAQMGYAMLLEKPMAPTAAECRRIVEAVVREDICFAVAHVLRYTDYTQKVKSMLDSGLIGDLVGIEHLEPVGFYHFAHSFVRGNWRNEAKSSFVLLTKSCHDIDWLRYIMGRPMTRVSSFGALHHFCRANQPAGAAGRCLDCAVESTCPYSAKKIYLDRVRGGHTAWPVDIITSDCTETGVIEALRTGPYGRCVYACDNDVADYQAVNIEFAGGGTASFAVTAFTPMGGRKTRFFGTRGYLDSDSSLIRHYDFLTDQWNDVDTQASDASLLGAHGGGDWRLMEAFCEAVATGDRSTILSGPAETLESHLAVFAAERARRERAVVTIEV